MSTDPLTDPIAHAEVDELLAELHTSVSPSMKRLLVLTWKVGRNAGLRDSLDLIKSRPAADDIEALKDLAAIKPESLRA